MIRVIQRIGSKKGKKVVNCIMCSGKNDISPVLLPEIVPHDMITNTILLWLRYNESGTLSLGKKDLMLNPGLDKGGC
jgi:hypothetical protein